MPVATLTCSFMWTAFCGTAPPMPPPPPLPLLLPLPLEIGAVEPLLGEPSSNDCIDSRIARSICAASSAASAGRPAATGDPCWDKRGGQAAG